MQYILPEVHDFGTYGEGWLERGRGGGNYKPGDTQDVHRIVWTGKGIKKGSDQGDKEKRSTMNYLCHIRTGLGVWLYFEAEQLEEIGDKLGCLGMALSFTEMRTIKFIKVFHLIASVLS